MNENNENKKYGLGMVYIGGLYNKSDLDEYKNDLKKVGLDFKSLDKSGQIYNKIEEYSFLAFIMFQTPLILDILKGCISASVWEGIKLFIIKAWKKARGEKYKKITSNKIEEKNVSFGLILN